MATSLGTYAELQSAIASWNFARTDLPVENIILLAETRINRDLKLRNAYSDQALTAVVDARTIALPSGFISASDCWIVQTWGRELLSPILPAINTAAESGKPCYWAIDGETLAFERPCDDDYSIVLRCITKLALASTSTNWLLTNYPDVYLAASNVEAATWIQDDAQAVRWNARYEAALSGVNSIEARSQAAPLRTEIPVIGPFDYNRGY